MWSSECGLVCLVVSDCGQRDYEKKLIVEVQSRVRLL